MPNGRQLPYHTVVEDQIAPFGSRKAIRPPGPRVHIEHKHFIVEERTLSYTCQTHTHSFVPALIDRLIDRSVPGLLGADTEYETDLTLLDATQVRVGDGAPFVIPAGERVRIADGARFTRAADNTEARCAADRILAVVDGRELTLDPGIEIRLAAGSGLIRTDRSVITLVAVTRAAVATGRPVAALFAEVFTTSAYAPSGLITAPYPVDELDFSTSGPYSVYNWELFYHIPLTVGIYLSKNQRFDVAQRWFHYVFDPTDNSDGPTPERYWKAKPLRTTDVEMAEEVITELSTLGDGDPRKDDLLASLASWKDSPFRPHIVARHRHSAFMFKAVFAYLDNLIAWGDTLFRQDSPESVDEALQLYILAADILGKRPGEVPRKSGIRALTYAEFKNTNAVSAFGNVLRDIEAELPLDVAPLPTAGGDRVAGDRFATLRTLGASLYFCVPRNDKLMGYWDTVADRLFKIRNSLNIQGVFRQLPLFEPPIDPALLARAVAAGVDLNGGGPLAVPVPPVRFGFLVQKASEICQEVKSLGAGLLAAMEKEDNEALSILRAKHERVILGLTETVRYAQWQDAIKAREGMESSIAGTVARYVYYERLLGKQESEIKIPALDALDIAALEKKKLKAAEPIVPQRPIDVDIAQDVDGLAGGKLVSSYEVQELEKLDSARGQYNAAAGMETGAAALGLIPHFGGEAEPMGAGASLRFGGEELAKMLSLMALSTRTSGDMATYEASKAAKVGGYARREQEWTYQSNLAANEITQQLKQLRGAQIREAIAERELKNHQQQMKHAEEVERFLADERKGKKTSQGLYAWMKRETRGLYSQCFQLAYDVAKKAERALQYELGDDSMSFVSFGYAAGREGLLSGEKLHLDVRRMEMAYHELNAREYELTKHISLLQIAPEELLRLRRTGVCRLSIPEELFDLDCPGHYFRRIKSVALSIPCVVGPYASVNCTLTLERGRFRSDAADVDNFPDGTFVEINRAQSVVTSSAQSDSGMFETNLRDERYLPFEGYGVESTWSLRLPGADDGFRQFDYESIADVVLHVRYTAREGGEGLRIAARTHLGEHIGAGGATGTVRLFSMRHDFPSEWARFRMSKPADGEQPTLTITLRPEHFPFWSTGRLGTLTLGAAIADGAVSGKLTVKPSSGSASGMESEAFVKDASLGNLYRASFANKSLERPDTLAISLPTSAVENLWLAVAWGKT